MSKSRNILSGLVLAGCLLLPQASAGETLLKIGAPDTVGVRNFFPPIVPDVPRLPIRRNAPAKPAPSRPDSGVVAAFIFDDAAPSSALGRSPTRNEVAAASASGYRM